MILIVKQDLRGILTEAYVIVGFTVLYSGNR